MFSPRYTTWGCRCCSKGYTYPTTAHQNYNVYLAYKGTTPPSTTTTTTTTPDPANAPHGLLVAPNRTCSSSYKHFSLSSTDLCAMMTLSTSGCAKEFYQSPKYTTWGCSCCRAGQTYPGYFNA